MTATNDIQNIRPLTDKQTAVTIRPFGLCLGEFLVPDDFDAPLPDEVLALFE